MSSAAGTLRRSLEAVTYRLALRGGPQSDWVVRRLHLVEAVSEPYALSLDVKADLDVETDDLLGADVDLEIGRSTFERHIYGVIERVELQGVIDDRLGVRLYVSPAFKLLVQHIDTRIFQDKKVTEILDEVLTAALAQYGRKVDMSRLDDVYLSRDYCVQYGESDFHFCSRLMEEEGISYFFEPETEDGEPTGVELMILADQDPSSPNSDFPEIEGEIPDQIPIMGDTTELGDTEALHRLEWVQPQAITRLSTRRFNWKRPDPANPPVAVAEQPDARGRVREVYLPDARRRIEDQAGDDAYMGTEHTEDEVPLTRRRFQMYAGERAYGKGASNVTCLCAGGIFTLGDHSHAAIALSKLLVTRVVHTGCCPDADRARHASERSDQSYYNSFECIPAHRVLHSREATPKPRIFGPQTATVVGPPGKEIHTDAHGRIKVLFHWDRLSSGDQSSSCWVRVAQMWAGHGWGTWFVPRVGMEVVVEFLDGNPDRPLVVGCVYNGANTTPYAPHEEPTKSTIKTRSSPGGDGFNELRFEDAKGAEEIFVHAQRDYNEVVQSNRSRRVGGNETVTIGGNQVVTVNGAPVHGNAESPRRGRQTSIDGHEYIETTKTIHLKAPQRIVLEVPGSSIIIEPGGIKLVSGNGASITMDDDVTAMSSAGSSMVLSEGISIVTDTTLALSGRVATVAGDSEVILKGGMIRLN